MAKESSFDVVSTVDMQEVDNAYQQAARELTQRYDLKGTGATLELSKKDGAFKIEAPSEFVASQVRDILGSKLAPPPSGPRRGPHAHPDFLGQVVHGLCPVSPDRVQDGQRDHHSGLRPGLLAGVRLWL